MEASLLSITYHILTEWTLVLNGNKKRWMMALALMRPNGMWPSILH